MTGKELILAKKVGENVEKFVNMKMSADELIKILYEGLSDDHGVKHIRDVYKQAEGIVNKKERRNLSTVEELAVILHDIGNHIDREKHHLVGAVIVESGLTGLTPINTLSVHIISRAVENHRASSRNRYDCWITELVRAADRPIIIDTAVIRTYQYGMNRLGMSSDEAITRVKEHITNKYGNGGYNEFPELLNKYYSDEIELFNHNANNINDEMVKEILIRNKII